VIVTAPVPRPSKPRRRPRTEDSPAWSPDGSTLAFLSDAESRAEAALSLRRGTRRRAASPPFRLSRDAALVPANGRSLAVLSRRLVADRGSAVRAAASGHGAWSTLRCFEQRIAVVNLDCGRPAAGIARGSVRL